VKNITIMHGMLGFVISLLLVLELIPLMIDGGKDENVGLVNNSRNFAIKLSAILHDEKIINTFEK
jgi:putative membrane protein